MDWSTYKQICDRYTVMSRWMLTQSAILLSKPLVRLLAERTSAQPIEKPVGHKGGAATDMFQIGLSAQEAQRIVQALEVALLSRGVELAKDDRAEIMFKSGHFLLAWQELLVSVESSQGARSP